MIPKPVALSAPSARSRDQGKESADNIRASGTLVAHRKAEDMTAPRPAQHQKTLDQRAPSKHDSAGERAVPFNERATQVSRVLSASLWTKQAAAPQPLRGCAVVGLRCVKRLDRVSDTLFAFFLPIT